MTTTTLRRPKCSIIYRFIFILPCPLLAFSPCTGENDPMGSPMKKMTKWVQKLCLEVQIWEIHGMKICAQRLIMVWLGRLCRTHLSFLMDEPIGSFSPVQGVVLIFRYGLQKVWLNLKNLRIPICVSCVYLLFTHFQYHTGFRQDTEITEFRYSATRLWAQNLNVILLCNPVTTQWCSTRGQMSHNVTLNCTN